MYCNRVMSYRPQTRIRQRVASVTLPVPSRWRPVRRSRTAGRRAGRQWSTRPSARRSFSPARRTHCPNPSPQTSSNSPPDGATSRCSRSPARSALRQISATAHFTFCHYLRANPLSTLIGAKHIHRESTKRCHHNYGYNFVNS